ncbi:MAG TPA: 2-C-methyl-D-erythritol 4-phosphate cytidylyltransferase [Candidatus Limnocylindria bacterium]|nr:2-C-methyl-D-erythritol 4-phosphate cytidylyltransferase [Candidatus Limnocylindria bacterium]
MPAVLAILAAGSSSRAGVDKVLADLGGHPVLLWSLQAGQVAGCFSGILVVAPAERLAAVTAATQGRDGVRVIAGGATRTASSWAALEAAGDAGIIAIHDAARPFVPPSLFQRCVEIARAEGSAVAGLPLADTIRRANEAGASEEEIEREGLWAAQTPQVFRRDLLEKARAATGDRSFGDDAAAVVAAGLPVKMVPGERRNLKITTIEDLAYARELVAKGLVGLAAWQVTR